MAWFEFLPEGAIPLHGLLTVLGLLVYILGSHALNQRRHPSAAIAWVMSILLLPEIGVPLYLMFGTRKLPKAARRPVVAVEGDYLDEAGAPGWMQRLTAAMAMPPAAGYRALHVHQDGAQARLALFALIDSARERLEISTFILGRDAFGDALLERLAVRAQAGVRVRLLVDGVGSLMAGRRDFEKIRRQGIEVTQFAPPLRSPFQWPLRGRTNLRNHRKLVVADRQRVWSGGRNLADQYFEGSAVTPAWIDLSFDAEGQLAAQAAELFEHDWNFACRPSQAWLERGSEHQWQKGAASRPLAQWLPSGPDYADDTVHTALMTGVFRAQRQIFAVTPYLVPDESLLAALVLAARRGVQVDIIVPARSNHRLADIARNRAMRDLARAGARVWLSPSMVHAKAVVIDDSMALVGSVNLDSRSLFLNYELMAVFYAPAEIARFRDWLKQQCVNTKPYVASEPGLVRYMLEGLVTWTAFQL